MATPLPVSLDEFKAHLNLSTGTKESDAELTLHLTAATAAVEKRIGPLITRDFTEQVRGRNGAVTVNKTPLVSVTALTAVGGTSWDVTTLHGDPSGVITIATGGRLPDGRYDVGYKAGRGDTASEDHKLAVLYVAEQLWEMQRGSVPRPAMFGVAARETATSAQEAGYVYRGFALPRRALELLSGDEEIGFA
ncbi:MAG TPA: head-tail connector protein [Nocardioidaceae bacterium]|jgi:hypothetical protein